VANNLDYYIDCKLLFCLVIVLACHFYVSYHKVLNTFVLQLAVVAGLWWLGGSAAAGTASRHPTVDDTVAVSLAYWTAPMRATPTSTEIGIGTLNNHCEIL
jgi:hypothetical protein